MDQKMKNFDRSIEKMMNEHEVAPPFGMWNRIAAELETSATPIPVFVNSPIPQRSVYGFIAVALLISASLLTAYLVNNSTKEETTPVTKALATKAAIAAPVITEIPTLVFREETKPTVSTSQTKAAKPFGGKTIATQNPTTITAQLPVTEVLVPSQEVVHNNTVTEPYFFPAIDAITPQAKVEEKATASVTKTAKKISKSIDDDNREISFNDMPKIKFRPKKHRTFTYGKIIRKK